MNSALALVLILLAGAGGIAAGWMLRTARTPAVATHDNSTGYASPIPAPTPPTSMPAEPDRRLITSLIGVHDLDGGTSARDRIREDLAQVNVHMLDATPGVLFDSVHHKAVTGVAAQTSEQVGTIAALIRPGWTSPAGIIRFPEVSVYVDPMPV